MLSHPFKDYNNKNIFSHILDTFPKEQIDKSMSIYLIIKLKEGKINNFDFQNILKFNYENKNLKELYNNENIEEIINVNIENKKLINQIIPIFLINNNIEEINKLH